MRTSAGLYGMIFILNTYVIHQHVRLTSIAYHAMRIAHLKGGAKLVRALLGTTKYLDFMGSIMMLIASSLRCFMYAYDIYGLEGKLTSDVIIQTILYRLPQWLDMGIIFLRLSIWHKVLGGLDSSWIQKSKFITPLLPAIFSLALVVCGFASLVNASVALVLLALIILGIVVCCRMYWRLRAAENFEKEHGEIDGVESDDSIMLRRNRREVLLGIVPFIVIGTIIVGTVLLDGVIFVQTITGYRIFLILTIGGEVSLYFFVSLKFYWVYQWTFDSIASTSRAAGPGSNPHRKLGRRETVVSLNKVHADPPALGATTGPATDLAGSGD